MGGAWSDIRRNSRVTCFFCSCRARVSLGPRLGSLVNLQPLDHVLPLLARSARSPGVFRSAAVLPAVFRCFLERLTPPGAHSKAFGAPFWPPGCLPEASWGPLGRHPGAQEPPRAPQKRPESPPRAAKSAPRAPQERPKRPQAAPSDSELYF